MPFHVELRHSHHRARAFNLDEPTLRRTVLEPWVGGVALRLGGRDWDPRESSLRVLEGELLAPADLAHGQGWHHAERSGGRDVARALLATAGTREPSMTVLASSVARHDAAARIVGELAVTFVDWAAVRAALLARDRAAPLAHDRAAPLAHAALVVAEPGASPRWHFDAGLALGAFGPRAVLATLDGDAEAPIEGMPALRLDVPDPLSALAERLRLAGCAVRPRAKSG